MMIYFDNAATTFPKPDIVYRRTDEFCRRYAGNPGRGAHRLAVLAAEHVYHTREVLADMFGCEPEGVVFTMNTTYALNIAIKSVVGEGDHVLISSLEHNSVLRPVDSVCAERHAGYDIFEVSESDDETLENIRRKINEKTRVLISIHTSNITPITLPVGKIGELCRERGILYIVDAAQSAGVYPIDMQSDNIDILCLPGHKGLYGYQGCGVMIFGGDIDGKTLIEGGSGSDSIPLQMPLHLPDKYEAGTLAGPSIVSLGYGAEWVMHRSEEKIYSHENMICEYIMKNLSDKDGVRIYNKSSGCTFLFNIDGITPAQTSRELDRRGIYTRAGLHCSPLAHKHLGTFPDGAVRASFGAFSTVNEASAFCDAVLDIRNTII